MRIIIVNSPNTYFLPFWYRNCLRCDVEWRQDSSRAKQATIFNEPALVPPDLDEPLIVFLYSVQIHSIATTKLGW